MSINVDDLWFTLDTSRSFLRPDSSPLDDLPRRLLPPEQCLPDAVVPLPLPAHTAIAPESLQAFAVGTVDIPVSELPWFSELRTIGLIGDDDDDDERVDSVAETLPLPAEPPRLSWWQRLRQKD